MTRSNRMNTIINITANEKDTAAKQLAHSQELLEQSQTQLADMKRVREGYSSQLYSKTSDPRSVSEMQGIRTFIQQLDVAIQQLEQQLLERKNTSQMYQDQWMKLRNKTQALSDIKVRYKKDEQKTVDQREQFESDELSQRKGNK